MLCSIIGGKYVKQQVSLKNRKELKAKMQTVFGEKMKGLSTELQEILIDDMTTAFENRMYVLNRAHAEAGY
jgi:hypothetical protein